jgi:hypothetical protein
VKAVGLALLAGCTVTTSASMSPATAKLECLDCEDKVAVGMPIRVLSSWTGSCTESGYQRWLTTDKDNGNVEWERVSFTKTEACDEHHYKLWVWCSTKCVVRAIDSPDTSTVKLLGIHPVLPGPLTFRLEIRDPKTKTVVKELASPSILVRAPDEVSAFEQDREIDGESKVAWFAGYEYFLEPGTARAGKPPTRGVKYVAPVSPQAPDHADVEAPRAPERMTRVCKTRVPGAMVWRPCAAGIRAGDDVRIEVTAWEGVERVPWDLTLVNTAPDQVAWTCYRAEQALPGAQICMRYGVPAGEHTLHWAGLGFSVDETIVVGGGS